MPSHSRHTGCPSLVVTWITISAAVDSVDRARHVATALAIAGVEVKRLRLARDAAGQYVLAVEVAAEADGERVSRLLRYGGARLLDRNSAQAR